MPVLRLRRRLPLPTLFPFRERLQLAALASIAILIVILIAVYVLVQLRESLRSRVELNAQNLASSVVETYDSLFDMIDVALAVSADDMQLQYASGRPDKAHIDAFLATQARRIPHVAFLRATDRDGQVLYGLDAGQASASLADREFFLALKNNPQRGLYLAKPVIGKITQRPLMTLARAVRDKDGRFLGTVYASLTIAEIESMLARIQMAPDSSLALRDRDLGLIARQTFGASNPIPIGSLTLSRPFADTLARQPQAGTYTSDDSSLDPIVRIYSYRRSAKYGYLVNVGTPFDAALREWRRQAWVLAALVLVFSALVLGMSLQIRRASGRLGRLIGSLKRSRQKLQKHHLQLREADERWRFAVEGSGDGVWDYDVPTAKAVYSRRYHEMLGYDDGEFPPPGTDWFAHVHPDDLPRLHETLRHQLGGPAGSYSAEIRMRCKDGQYIWIYARGMIVSRAPDGTPLRMVGTHTDISALKAAEHKVWNEANFDALTQLPNRRLFYDRLDLKVRLARRDGSRLALLFIDLDHFKEVNDTLGHNMGDKLLVEAAQRIREIVRDSDTVARLGGDEFTVLLSAAHELSATAGVADKIIARLSEPYRLGDSDVFVSASVGIALYPDDAVNVNDLVRHADQAMYAAKSAGRKDFCFFTKAMQDAALARMNTMNDLRRALSGGQLAVHYQPIIDLRSGAVVKAEALVRWCHPERGMVSPAEFIPVAESTGMIHDIDAWVFQQASRQLVLWQSAYRPDFQISINTSPMAFSASRRGAGPWHAAMNPASRTARGIVIEITEGVLMDSSAGVAETLIGFRDAGIQVAIDDFGTGYSSLAYLKKFDIDYLKIDQSFIRGLARDSADFALCEAIIVMAHKLGLQVVAEGVETAQQRDLLCEIGCDFGQGYLFSRPVDAAAFSTQLLAQTPPVQAIAIQ